MIRIINTQYSHFLQQADILRRSGSLCDAIISVESQTFRAHRLVLACVSKTLAQQLTQGDVSPLHCTLELFSPHTFQQVLDFTYTQALEVSVNDLCLLLRAAQLLEMQSLEEQCQMQLDSLDCKTTEAGESRGTRELIESRETTEERDERQKGSPVPEEDLQRGSSPVKEANDDPLMEALPQPDTAEGCTSPPSPRKRLKMSPMSATIYARDSVIASPATSHSSLSPPWVSSRNKWHPVNTLRRIAQNYSSLVAAQSLQSSQSVVAYPFPLSTPHMYPLFTSSIPSQVHGSVMGYPGILHPYKQHFFTGSPELGDILKQGLLGKKDLSHKAFIGTTQTNGQRYAEEHGPRTQRVKDCHHCSTRLLGSPWLQESTSTPSGSGEACVGHRFCGRGYGVEHTLRSHRQGHGGEKPYECKRCPKRFSLKHQLDTHHRVHTGEKPFECRLCGQRSRDYSAMIKHLRTHGGATPYQCTVCLEFCSSLAAMQKHVKSHPVQDFPPDWTISSTYLYTSHVDHTQT